MELKVDKLHFQLIPLGEVSGQGALRVRVAVSVPVFSGVYDDVERGEFMVFDRELAVLDAGLNPGNTARLEPVERDFSLLLTMMDGGHISGDYRFQGGWDVVPPILSGSFAMDQTYLPALRRETKAILALFERQPSS